jgi:hypothetical protein
MVSAVFQTFLLRHLPSRLLNDLADSLELCVRPWNSSLRRTSNTAFGPLTANAFFDPNTSPTTGPYLSSQLPAIVQ